MTDNGTLITTLGRLGSGVYQAVKGRLWDGVPSTITTYRPDAVEISATMRTATLTPSMRTATLAQTKRTVTFTVTP